LTSQDQRVITTDRGSERAKEWGCAFLETSAKTGLNIQEVFLTATRLVATQTKKLPTDLPKKDKKKCLIV